MISALAYARRSWRVLGLKLVYVLFIPSGSDSLIDANGDTFKVRG